MSMRSVQGSTAASTADAAAPVEEDRDHPDHAADATDSALRVVGVMPTATSAAMAAKSPKKKGKKKSRVLRLFGAGRNKKKHGNSNNGSLASSCSRSLVTFGTSSIGGSSSMLGFEDAASNDAGSALDLPMSSLVLHDDDDEADRLGSDVGGVGDVSPLTQVAEGSPSIVDRSGAAASSAAQRSQQRGESTDLRAAGLAQPPLEIYASRSAERELEAARERYEQAVVRSREAAAGGGDSDDGGAAPSQLVRRSRSELRRAAVRYLEDEVGMIRAARRAAPPLVTAVASSSSSAEVVCAQDPTPLLDLVDRLKSLGQLYDEELGEYGEALRCYKEVLRIETNLLKDRDRLFGGDNDDEDRREFVACLSASIEESRRVVGRLHYRIHGAVTLSAAAVQLAG